ncbi:TolC family protein [Spirosoma taeanense]|uniref:TolC family protein n=2 Tax=Spirosoma taeanense TaxID=2735870 RepID=A0A6M5YFX2_9BACT|nr:TolC family protein [Spirosoma taeanense]
MRVAYKQIWVGMTLCLVTGMSVVYAQNTPGALAPGNGTVASTRLSLQQCIEIAQQNNVQIRQGQLTVDNTNLQLRQSRLNLLPTANFQSSQSLSGGRNIDPRSNQFVQQSINSGNYQFNATATLFNGFTLKNTVKQNDLALQASQQELRATQNTVSLTVAQNYLNTLTGTEQLLIAQRQADVTRAQLERMQKLVSAGSAPEANLLELQATLAGNELDIVNAQNTLDLARVALLQAMNVPINQAFEVEPINVPDPGLTPYTETVQQIFDVAASNLPEVKGADLRVRSAALGVEVAKGYLYPTVALSGNLSTLYSSAARRFSPNGSTTQQQTLYFVTGPDGLQTPIYQNVPGGDMDIFPYFDQIANNFNRSVSLILRVPIFQGYQSRNRITTARISQQSAELTALNTRLQLRQQIETAYTNMRAGANRYRATQTQVVSLERAFQVAESRLNAGAINATDYSIAKTNLDRARASLVQAKYDYVFRTKILDYYQNKPIAF